jgi:hypothetical protein
MLLLNSWKQQSLNCNDNAAYIYIYVNCVLTDETNATGNNEASKKSSRESDSCEYHIYTLLIVTPNS